MEENTNAAAQVARAMLAEVIDRCQKNYDEMSDSLRGATDQLEVSDSLRRAQREAIQNLTHHLAEAKDEVEAWKGKAEQAEDAAACAQFERDEWKQKAHTLGDALAKAESSADADHARVMELSGFLDKVCAERDEALARVAALESAHEALYYAAKNTDPEILRKARLAIAKEPRA